MRDEVGESGLLYMRQRYYDPALARFLNRDPIGYAGGLNLFSYASNNPVNTVDPNGLQEAPPPGAPSGYKLSDEDFIKVKEALQGFMDFFSQLVVAETIVSNVNYVASGIYDRFASRAVSAPVGPCPLQGQLTDAELANIWGRGPHNLYVDLATLKGGGTVYTTSGQYARRLLQETQLAPYIPYNIIVPGGRPTGPAWPGTYRGDLVNVMNPRIGSPIHPEGAAPDMHRLNPHYNLQFWNGEKAHIIIVEP